MNLLTALISVVRRALLLTAFLNLFSACQKKPGMELRFEFKPVYSKMSAVILDANSAKVKEFEYFGDVTYELDASIGESYSVEVAAFSDLSDDTLAFLKQNFTVDEKGYIDYFSVEFPLPIDLDDYLFDYQTSGVTARWNFSELQDDVLEVFLSDDPLTVFETDNIVAQNCRNFFIEMTGKDQFIAIRKTHSSSGSETMVRSEVVRIDFQSSPFITGMADEWIEFEMFKPNYKTIRIDAKQGNWYLLEFYDALNSDQTGSALVLGTTDNNTDEIRTRSPDGRSRFIRPMADQVMINTAIAGEGFGGTFKLRLRSISPSNLSDIEELHEFSENNQIKFAEQYFEAGTYNVKTRQNDILNEAYVYYSLLMDNEFLVSKEFDQIQITNNIGPNFRDDTTTQNNRITIDQAGMVQMIMINSYHNAPGSLIVEID